MAKCALGCYQEWVFPKYHKHWGTTGSVVFRPATMMASSQGESWRLSAQKHERRRRSSAGECLEQPGRAGRGGPLDCPSFRCHPSFPFSHRWQTNPPQEGPGRIGKGEAQDACRSLRVTTVAWLLRLFLEMVDPFGMALKETKRRPKFSCTLGPVWW